MDFAADIHAHVMATLPHTPRDTASLVAKSPGELLVYYLNWRGRFVPAISMRVHISQALASKRPLADPAHEAALAAIVEALCIGKDVTPHLSRDVTRGFTSRPRRGRHIDLMLNDWGVHHLHLSTTLDPDGFVQRTGPVLFAAFAAGQAWLIDVLNHGRGFPTAWTTRSVLETVVTEWPGSGLLVEVPGILPSTEPWTDDERLQLRNAGMATMFEHGGKVYMPRAGGISSGGLSGRQTGVAMAILARSRHVEAELRARTGPVWAAFAAEPTLPDRPDFELVIGDDGLAVVERESQLAHLI